jgi:hypothetical protein
VSRPFSRSKPLRADIGPNGHNGNGRDDRSYPDGGAELVSGPSSVLPARYESRPARPFIAIGIRVLLWSAVALGCLGGIVGLLRPPAAAQAPTSAAPDPGAVPASVAGTAELTVREWLTATADDEDELIGLFVEPPVLDGLAAGDLSVGRVTTIAGRVLQEDYWAVTVEAEVTETVPIVDPDDPAATENGAEPETGRQTSIWYLEVPIVGDPETGLLALTRPSVLPGPPTPTTGWRASLNAPTEPGDDDPTVQTVEGFFDAMLAGSGDAGRYVAPGLEVTPADPPPFTDTEVVDVAVDKLGEGEYRVLAQVRVATPGGARQIYSYELFVVERVDRLEITHFAGAPTRIAGSARPEQDEDEAPEGDQGTAGDAGGEGAPPTSSVDTTAPAGAADPVTDPAADESPTPTGG